MSPTERPDSLTSGFTARATATPDAEALRVRGAGVTYAELHDRSEALARALLRRGVQVGDTVAFRHPRSIDGVVGMLGILRAGAAVLPLPPELPRLRATEILALVQPAAVVAADAVDEDDLPDPRLAGPRASTVAELEDAGRQRPVPALPTVPPASPAFILSTSGSTGRPKLIVRSHRSFFHRLRWTWRTHPYGASERVCQKSPLTTTHAVYELFEPLLGGVPTVIVDDAEVRDLPAFWSRLRTEEVSRLLVVPSMMRTSLELDGFSPPDLRVVVLMGEAVDGPLAERLARAFPPSTALYSIYGSTEASSTLVADLRADVVDGRLPLGRPISDAVTVEVLDDAGARVDPGTEGRLHIAGTPLFDEYLGDPAATNAVTRIGPEGERLFDSRDQVLVDPEGRLHYRGRVDTSVKIRGFTVNTAEVESVLTAAPGVRNAAVLAAPAGGDAQNVVLAAFIAPGDVPEEAARRYCRERLPDYMVPGVLVTLDRLPTLPNGKIDRVALLERLHGEPEARAADHGGGTLGQVCSVWETVLGHAYFEPDQGFFAAGGDSLSVFRLAQRLREAFDLGGERIDERWVFAFSTPAEQAEAIDRTLAGDTVQDVGAVSPLVTLRDGSPGLAPLFLISPAGGSPAPYRRMVERLETPREIIAVQDPYLLGARPIDQSFEEWAGIYESAIRERAGSSPVHLVAYSSAAAFGLEIARHLRNGGVPVPTLVVVDPLSLGQTGNTRFEKWAFTSTWGRRETRVLVKVLGRIREPFVRRRSESRTESAHAGAAAALSDPIDRPDPADPADLRRRIFSDPGSVANLTALIQLNTGAPTRIDPGELPGTDPEKNLRFAAARVSEVLPELDAESFERLAAQYHVQVAAQHRYRLRRVPGPVVLVEPESQYLGLMEHVLRPHVGRLATISIPLAPPPPELEPVLAGFGPHAPHFRCMRDDDFSARLAVEVDRRLPDRDDRG